MLLWLRLSPLLRWLGVLLWLRLSPLLLGLGVLRWLLLSPLLLGLPVLLLWLALNPLLLGLGLGMLRWLRNRASRNHWSDRPACRDGLRRGKDGGAAMIDGGKLLAVLCRILLVL